MYRVVDERAWIIDWTARRSIELTMGRMASLDRIYPRAAIQYALSIQPNDNLAFASAFLHEYSVGTKNDFHPARWIKF